MTAAVTYRHLSPTEARSAASALKPVYGEVFSQSPYNEGPEMPDVFVGWINAESKHPGFAMVVAYTDETPIGMAYGYTMPPGEWFRHTDSPAPSDIKATAKFAVMEWAVLSKHRGRGIGRVLMVSLLDARPESWAVLTVNPAAEAQAIYERAGWRQVASTKARADRPSMSVMVLDLTVHHDSP